jgi:hypothetical protein
MTIFNKEPFQGGNPGPRHWINMPMTKVPFKIDMFSNVISGRFSNVRGSFYCGSSNYCSSSDNNKGVVPKAAIIHFILRSIVLVVPIVFGRFLGSEGTAIMTTGGTLILFGILIFGLILIFRLSSLNLKIKCGIRLVLIIYLGLLFSMSVFFYFLRSYVLSHCGILLSSFFILSAGVAQVLPLPDPTGPSRSSSWTEDSFEIGVLLEPFDTDEETSRTSAISRVARDEAGPSLQPRIIPNASLEASIRNRISHLERPHVIAEAELEKKTPFPFLYTDAEGEYWQTVKTVLDQADSQSEYNRQLEFENRDLRIRELKHSCYLQFQMILAANPDLAERAGANSWGALEDFFHVKREQIDTDQGLSIAQKDERELLDLNQVRMDLVQQNPHSPCIKEIFRF